MHELAITHSLLRTVLHHAEAAHAVHILAVRVTIGELSTVVDDSVQFYWDIAASGTIAEGAQLLFNRIPCTLRCETCSIKLVLASYSGQCPQCGGQRMAVISGNEFQLESIEIEEMEVSYV